MAGMRGRLTWEWMGSETGKRETKERLTTDFDPSGTIFWIEERNLMKKIKTSS